MLRLNGSATHVVKPWLVSLLIVMGGAYAIGTTPAPSQAKLQPPSGSITGTMKTLNEVEPRTPVNERFVGSNASALFVIDAPGSYFLPDDIAVGPNKIGIHIKAAPVTLDMMGHTINGFDSSLDLIIVDPLADRVVIKDGTLRRSGGRGLTSSGDTIVLDMIEVAEAKRAGMSLDVGRAATLRDVTVADVGTAPGSDRYGIRLVGPGSVRAHDIEVTGTGGAGIATAAATRLTLEDALVADTGAQGITVESKATLRRVSVENTNGHGIDAGDDATIVDCHIDNITGNGIHAGSRCKVQDNRIYVNSSNAAPLGAGIMVHGDDTVTKSNVIVGGGSAFFGIRLVGDRNLMASNRNYDNAGYSLTSDNMVGNILTSINAYESNNDPDANFDN